MSTKLVKRFKEPAGPFAPKPYSVTYDWNKEHENLPSERINRDITQPAIQRVRTVTKPIQDRYDSAQKRNKQTAALQLALWNKGFFKGLKDRKGRDVTYNTAVDGMRLNKGGITNAAIEAAKAAGYDVDLEHGLLTQRVEKPQPTQVVNSPSQTQSTGFSENGKRLLGNLVRNPISAVVDATLFAADRLGVPSNATNYLRDLNVSIPYRMSAASHAAVKTLFNDKSFDENYQNQLQNPNFIQRIGMIHPLINRNANFNDEQMQVIRNMAGSKGYITNADIKRESEDGRYGAFGGSIGSYFSPSKVVQTAIGRSSGNNGILTDYFDVNTQSEEAQRDNQKYKDKANEEGRGWNYGTLRSTMPYTSSIDIMPDEYKIKTVIDLN